MIWRAVYGAGGSGGGDTAPGTIEIPLEPSIDTPEPETPGLGDSKHFITLKSRATGIEYQCGLAEPRPGWVGRRVYLPNRVPNGTIPGEGSYQYQLVPYGLFTPEYFAYAFGQSPPFDGVGSLTGAELIPPERYPTGRPMWAEQASNPCLDPDGLHVLTLEEQAAYMFRGWEWDDCFYGGTSLLNIFLKDIWAAIVANPTAYQAYLQSATIIFDVLEAPGAHINMVAQYAAVDRTTYPEEFDAYVTDDGFNIRQYLKPVGSQQMGMLVKLQAFLYNAYGVSKYHDRRGFPMYDDGTGGLGLTFKRGISGFQRYEAPHSYLYLVNGYLMIGGDSANWYSSTGGVWAASYAWPHVEGFLLGLFGLTEDTLPSVTGGGVAYQYRTPGWAKFER